MIRSFAKKMPLSDLLQTEACVARTIKHAQKIGPHIPLLIVQGSQEHCVIPEAILQLSQHIRSTDQTIRWLNQTGHLLLEDEHSYKFPHLSLVRYYYADESCPGSGCDLINLLNQCRRHQIQCLETSANTSRHIPEDRETYSRSVRIPKLKAPLVMRSALVMVYKIRGWRDSNSRPHGS